MTKQALITAVKATAPATLAVTFDGKKTMGIDLRKDIARYRALAPLKKWEMLQTARPDQWGHAVRFADENCDLAADALWIDAHVQAGQAVSHEEFDAWRKRNRLSLTDIAAALGVTRRTATNYASGCHLIPKIVGLAMVGYETLHGKAA